MADDEDLTLAWKTIWRLLKIFKLHFRLFKCIIHKAKQLRFMDSNILFHTVDICPAPGPPFLWMFIRQSPHKLTSNSNIRHTSCIQVSFWWVWGELGLEQVKRASRLSRTNPSSPQPTQNLPLHSQWKTSSCYTGKTNVSIRVRVWVQAWFLLHLLMPSYIEPTHWSKYIMYKLRVMGSWQHSNIVVALWTEET